LTSVFFIGELVD